MGAYLLASSGPRQCFLTVGRERLGPPWIAAFPPFGAEMNGPRRRTVGGQSVIFAARGGESDHNKVLLDGIPLNEPGGIFYFNNLTTENLERVEIVRGAYSSLFGSDATSSVVQLFTKRGAGESRRPTVTACNMRPTTEGGSMCWPWPSGIARSP